MGPLTLLSTSSESKILNSPIRISSGIVTQAKNYNKNMQSGEPVAVLWSGSVESHFKNLISGELIKESVVKLKSKNTKMLVIADGDIILNDVDSITIASGETKYRFGKLNMDKFNIKNPDGSQKYQYGNLDFFMNVLDEMMYE